MKDLENKNVNDSDERLKQLIHLMCDNREEITKVNEIITEAKDFLYNLVINDEGYHKYSTIGEDSNIFFKKVNNVEIGKIEITFPDIFKFDKIIGTIWDENCAKHFDPTFIEGKIIRLYDKNLVLLQQSYKGTIGKEGRYFYILAHKKQLSKHTYLITCISLNINDNNKKFQDSFTNPFINSANSFSLDIECDEKIKNSSLRRMYIYISGYHIKRDDNCVKLTYIASMELGTSSLIPQFVLRKIKANKMALLDSLRKQL